MSRTALTAVCAAGFVQLVGAMIGLAAAREMDLVGNAKAGGKPAADVVVWLDAPEAPKPRETRLVLEQRNMEFSPRVLAAPVGSTVELPNNDRVFHNVFSFTNGKPFDLGLYPTGASKRIKLDRAAVNRLYCNIHPHMGAYIIAVDTPYYATSDKTGAFTIHGVPPGDYTYHAWRSGSDTLTATVTVGESTALEVAWK